MTPEVKALIDELCERIAWTAKHENANDELSGRAAAMLQQMSDDNERLKVRWEMVREIDKHGIELELSGRVYQRETAPGGTT